MNTKTHKYFNQTSRSEAKWSDMLENLFKKHSVWLHTGLLYAAWRINIKKCKKKKSMRWSRIMFPLLIVLFFLISLALCPVSFIYSLHARNGWSHSCSFRLPHEAEMGRAADESIIMTEEMPLVKWLPVDTANIRKRRKLTSFDPETLRC